MGSLTDLDRGAYLMARGRAARGCVPCAARPKGLRLFRLRHAGGPHRLERRAVLAGGQPGAHHALRLPHPALARRRGGKVAQPLRAALTGRSTSPGIFDVLAVLGREESLARLRDAHLVITRAGATTAAPTSTSWRTTAPPIFLVTV